jgi:hypothetical protein
MTMKKSMIYTKTGDKGTTSLIRGDDPWTASGVTWLEEKENIKVYTLPGGSHRTRIGSFDKKTQEEIMTLINRWLKE